MKIIIVGAGQMGYAAGFELLRRGVEVTYLDIDYSKKDSVPKGSVFIYTEDPCRFISSLDDRYDIDVIIGAAGYQLNEQLTKVAIEKKIHFCDLGGNNTIVGNQLKLNSLAEEAGIVVIPDCGLAPGLACMLAAKGIEQLGGTADVVNISVGGLPQNPQAPFNYALSWSVNGLINEYIEKSKILCGDKIVQVESLTDCEEFSLRYDGNDYEFFHTSGGISTLADTYLGKVKNLSYRTIRYSGHCALMSCLKALGMFDEHRSFIENTLNKVLPKINSNNPDIVIVMVTAYKDDYSNANNNRYVDFFIRDKFDSLNNISAMARTTGFSIASVAYLLGSGAVTKHIKERLNKSGGVIPGESSLPLDEYIKAINDSGINIESKITGFDTSIKTPIKTKNHKKFEKLLSKIFER